MSWVTLQRPPPAIEIFPPTEILRSRKSTLRPRCAAAAARPGVSVALQHSRIPDRSVTVFAGVDRAAVEEARSHMAVPPSSPCIALFKDGKPIHILERRHIEQMGVQMIAQDLAQAFDAHCARQGPAVSPEQFAKVVNVLQCSSTIPRYPG